MSEEKNTFLNHQNARTEEQRELMQRIEADGVCPFCAEYFTKYHPRPIIRETDSWFLTENMSPYKGTKLHLLFVYKPAHVTRISEIESHARVELFDLLEWAEKEFKVEGGAFFLRFGNTHYTGSSVEHLHAHLLVGDVDAPGHEPVRVKLG